MSRLCAAIIGLGRIGSRFDEEPGRTTIWSHAGAYLALPRRFALVAGVEPDPANRAAFARRCPDVPVFDDVAAMMRAAEPDVVSICTPAHDHVASLRAVLAAGKVRALWCEKPLSDSLTAAEAAAGAAEGAGAALYVSHVRRWTPLWRTARALLAEGRIGALVSLRIDMANRLWSIGSHAVDLALFLGGPVERVTAMPVPRLDEDGEPAIGAMLCFAGGATGTIVPVGTKDKLVVRAELFGSEGRMVVDEPSGRIALERFAPSRRYAGYVELERARSMKRKTLAETSPFVALARDIADAVPPACSGADALAGMRVLDTMARAA